MDTNERFFKLTQAAPATLAKIDNILEGRPASDEDLDIRTLNFQEAARRLGVSRPTVYRLVKARELETVLIGGLERIPVRNLVAYATRPARRAVRRAV